MKQDVRVSENWSRQARTKRIVKWLKNSSRGSRKRGLKLDLKEFYNLGANRISTSKSTVINMNSYFSWLTIKNKMVECALQRGCSSLQIFKIKFWETSLPSIVAGSKWTRITWLNSLSILRKDWRKTTSSILT